jgi:hypothetical protein
MTTTITVQSHNYPARVRVLDQVAGEPDEFTVSEERVLRPEDGVQTFYCTTSRKIEVQDIEYDHAEKTA